MASLKLKTMETTPVLFPGFEDEDLQQMYDLTVKLKFYELISAHHKLQTALKSASEKLMLRTEKFNIQANERDFLNIPTLTVLGGEATGYRLLHEVLKDNMYIGLKNSPPSHKPYWFKLEKTHSLYQQDELRSFIHNLNEKMTNYGFTFSGGTWEKENLFCLYVKYDYTIQHDWLK